MNMCHHASDFWSGFTVDPRDVTVFVFCFCEKGDKPANE